MNAINLSPAQAEALAHVPTGHEPHAQGTAQAIAQALDITTAQAAARLGALRKAGLVTRDAQGNGDGVATWARFDSLAPGLEAAQVDALRKAEAARPCRYQVDALETFGPECEAAPHGLAWRSDLKAETPAPWNVPTWHGRPVRFMVFLEPYSLEPGHVGESIFRPVFISRHRSPRAARRALIRLIRGTDSDAVEYLEANRRTGGPALALRYVARETVAPFRPLSARDLEALA